MKFSKLVSLGLIGLLTFGTVGCTTKTEEKKATEKAKTETTTEARDNMTLESYKTEFGKLYDTNIARLENYSKYKDIAVEEPTKDYPGNEAYLNELKKSYKDSEVKLQEFVNSLKKVKTDDPKLKEMNDKLIKEGDKVIGELKTRSKKLEEVPNDLMSKSEVEFRRGLNDLVKVDNTTKSDFEKMINDVNEFLGMKPSNTKK